MCLSHFIFFCSILGTSFELVEGTLHGSKDKKLVRVQCTYDNTWLPLCPPRSDLQTIMMEHTLSKSHAMAIQKEQGPIVPAITGLRGRPKKSSGKDPKQKSLSSFLVSTSINETEKGESHPMEKCSKAPCTSSFTIDPSTILCWGLWNETINMAGKVVGIKSLLDDQRNGREWCCEPQTHTIITNGLEEYSINGCFRHANCVFISKDRQPFPGFMCQFCRDIPKCTDF